MRSRLYKGSYIGTETSIWFLQVGDQVNIQYIWLYGNGECNTTYHYPMSLLDLNECYTGIHGQHKSHWSWCWEIWSSDILYHLFLIIVWYSIKFSFPSTYDFFNPPSCDNRDKPEKCIFSLYSLFSLSKKFLQFQRPVQNGPGLVSTMILSMEVQGLKLINPTNENLIHWL